MQICHNDEAEIYRTQIRRWIADNLPPDWHGIGALSPAQRKQFETDWTRIISAAGLVAPTWPVDYGGAGLTTVQAVVLDEELVRAGIMIEDTLQKVGVGLLGPTLLALGTEDQKRYFLPRLLAGEHRWCQGFSEPGSGSDLAGLATRAVLDGDEWVIDGQKVWTSNAHEANWIFVLCRTNPQAPKHRGLTFLLVPMDQPAVESRPIRNINGSAEFNEVFFTGARTRRENVVGAVDGGWAVAATLLGFERGGAAADAMVFRGEFDRLLSLARARGRTADPLVRQQLAAAYARIELIRYAGLRALARMMAGKPPGPEASIHKLAWSEHHAALTDLAVELLGLESLAPTGAEPGGFFMDLPGSTSSARSWVWTWLSARSDTIRGGTSEIQRNIIAERVLGLPREPQADTGPWVSIPR